MVVCHQRKNLDERAARVFAGDGFEEHTRCRLVLGEDFGGHPDTWNGTELVLEPVVDVAAVALARNRSIEVQFVVDVARHRLAYSIEGEAQLSGTGIFIV